jgi:hypothetical protein
VGKTKSVDELSCIDREAVQIISRKRQPEKREERIKTARTESGEVREERDEERE